MRGASVYKTLAKSYDALVPKEHIFRQRPFFRKLIRKYAVKSCLDCACGTGWHLFMLDALGIKCCGSDLSPQMLAQARKNLEGRNIPLRLGDFRGLSDSWEQKFDMVICMTTSFPHMLTGKDARTALDSIHRQLNPGGILVLDNGITDALLDTRPRCLVARIGRNQAFYFILEYPASTRVVFHVLHVRKTKDSFAHTFVPVPYNAMRKSCLESHFARTRFKKVQYFGDFAFARYSVKKSQRLIVVAQK